MHELFICEALLAEVERLARARKAQRVLRIAVDIGALSGVEATLLERAFTVARAGTIAATAHLELRTPPLHLHCRGCERQWQAARHQLACDACGEFQVAPSGGDELLLRQIEME
jgi:hydrogenase nickel incorporation protein HypA/HybF